MMRLLLILTASLVSSVVFAQGCCSGGGGSPIAGGAASGVLLPNQIEFSTSYQFTQSDVVYTGGNKNSIVGDLSSFSTAYNYFRMDYGVSEKFTFSLATGYHLNKSYEDTAAKLTSNKGIGDFILFPRYNIYNKKRDNYRTEVTLGLGMKIPIGSHSDSTITIIEIQGTDISFAQPIAMPSILQRGTGGNDMLIYAYWFRGYQKRAFRVFANGLYIKKGYNEVGQKFGDYASLSLFASKTILRNFGLTAQLKGESIKEVEGQDLIINVGSTGSKKLFFIPQLNYSYKSFTFFGMTELPLYQYLHGTQIASQWQFSMGVNYRFLTNNKEVGVLKALN